MKLKFMIVALAVLGLSPALYGQNFPTKPIELVVSSSPAAASISYFASSPRSWRRL